MVALVAASTLGWSSKVRYLLLLADAPAHGRDCNDDPHDTHPHGSPAPGCDVASAMRQLVGKGVELLALPVKQGKLDKTLAAMRRHYEDPAQGRRLEVEQLFDPSKMPAHAFHFVLCLDCSGSMQGSPWAGVVAAYQQLLSQRIGGQCQGDLVSVVTFDCYPHLQFQLQPVTNAPNHLHGTFGGTQFAPALDACSPLLAATPPGHTPVLVFMSDGQDGSGNAVAKVGELWRLYGGRGLQVHTIAFGHSGGLQLLQDMAAAAGGQYHSAATGLILSQVFGRIAADCTAVDGLVKAFSKKVSEMISTRITLDHL